MSSRDQSWTCVQQAEHDPCAGQSERRLGVTIQEVRYATVGAWWDIEKPPAVALEVHAAVDPRLNLFEENLRKRDRTEANRKTPHKHP
ncbi:MAG TPA: hypothetical protein ENH15_01445 [Actinobacteria bacterium]|nr:hypothetical protein [Actinomycetota bacterium]